MRVQFFACVASLALLAVACGGADEAAPEDEAAMIAPPGATPAPGQTGTTPPKQSVAPAPPAPAPDPPWDPSVGTHPEIVYVLGAGWNGWTWFCTGALVSRSVVVTAAHCLQSSVVKSWQVQAPSAPGAPKVAASKVKQFDGSFGDVAHPDLGIIILNGGIDLPRYAELTDVSASVDSGKAVSVAAIVRTEEKPTAPLEKTSAMPLSSTKQYGYDHGYGVPMYSAGGDSGAGLFLVEKGQMTHKLVAVEREPDPARTLDQLSRIEPAFIQWVKANGS